MTSHSNKIVTDIQDPFDKELEKYLTMDELKLLSKHLAHEYISYENPELYHLVQRIVAITRDK